MHRHQDHAPDKACLIQFTFVIKNLSTKNRNVTRSGNTTCTKTACLMMPSVRGAAHGATERERFFTVCSKRAHSAYTLASQALPSNGDTSLLHIIFPFGLCSTWHVLTVHFFFYCNIPIWRLCRSSCSWLGGELAERALLGMYCVLWNSFFLKQPSVCGAAAEVVVSNCLLFIV